MAPKTDVGTKRKLPSRSKDSNTKKPKYEKRPLPPPIDEADSTSDDDDFGDTSDHDDEGGAPLDGKKTQRNGDGPIQSQEKNGKTFERGEFILFWGLLFDLY